MRINRFLSIFIYIAVLLAGCQRLFCHSKSDPIISSHRSTKSCKSKYIQSYTCLHAMYHAPYLITFADSCVSVHPRFVKVIDQAVQCLKQHLPAGIGIIIESYASQEADRQLSFTRAVKIQKALIERGIPLERTKIVSLVDTPGPFTDTCYHDAGTRWIKLRPFMSSCKA